MSVSSVGFIQPLFLSAKLLQPDGTDPRTPAAPSDPLAVAVSGAHRGGNSSDPLLAARRRTMARLVRPLAVQPRRDEGAAVGAGRSRQFRRVETAIAIRQVRHQRRRPDIAVRIRECDRSRMRTRPRSMRCSPRSTAMAMARSARTRCSPPCRRCTAAVITTIMPAPAVPAQGQRSAAGVAVGRVGRRHHQPIRHQCGWLLDDDHHLRRWHEGRDDDTCGVQQLRRRLLQSRGAELRQPAEAVDQPAGAIGGANHEPEHLMARASWAAARSESAQQRLHDQRQRVDRDLDQRDVEPDQLRHALRPRRRASGRCCGSPPRARAAARCEARRGRRSARSVRSARTSPRSRAPAVPGQTAGARWCWRRRRPSAPPRTETAR